MKNDFIIGWEAAWDKRTAHCRCGLLYVSQLKVVVVVVGVGSRKLLVRLGGHGPCDLARAMNDLDGPTPYTYQ